MAQVVWNMKVSFGSTRKSSRVVMDYLFEIPVFGGVGWKGTHLNILSLKCLYVYVLELGR